MPCNQCGGALEITHATDNPEKGPFTEVYECANCGATGTISGKSDEPPRHWRKSGEVFD